MVEHDKDISRIAVVGSVVFVSLVLSRRLDVQHAVLFAIATTFSFACAGYPIRLAEPPQSSGMRMKRERGDFVTARER